MRLAARQGRAPRNNPLDPTLPLRRCRVYGPRPFRRRNPMARDQIDMAPIETRDDLVRWLEQGAKPKTRFRIGTEHEKFAFAIGRHEPEPYARPRGVKAL